MSQVLSRTSSKRYAATAVAGGLLLAGLTACSSSKSTGATGGTTPAAASTCPALGAVPASAPAPNGGVVNVYSVDGLMDTTDDNNWYNKEFKKFKDLTGITVKYTEDGSGGIETKVAQGKANQQADVLITLPPFIQKAALVDDVLQKYAPVCVDKVDKSLVDPSGEWEAVMGNYADFIYNSQALPDGPPKTWSDLLDPKFKQKLQYSTPGVAGDGTAVMIKAIHDFSGRQAAFDYFKSLQPNNLGPSSSTGKLETKVNKGDILVANGDIQMNYVDGKNSYPNNKIFFPAGPDGTPTTFALPYMAGLIKGGPNTDNGKKLLDFLLSEQAQLDTSAMAYGFPARSDIKPTDANYTALNALLQGVTVFPVDWTDVEKNFATDVKAWNTATGTAS
jgi:2-aminoethylphosphonate transport system substrate-binding protein